MRCSALMCVLVLLMTSSLLLSLRIGAVLEIDMPIAISSSIADY
jgi:hypothetical protein